MDLQTTYSNIMWFTQNIEMLALLAKNVLHSSSKLFLQPSVTQFSEKDEPY